MKYPKTIGVLSDTHCGSQWGLLAPQHCKLKQQPGQAYLWQCWMWLAKKWPKLDLLIVNGDIIDGKQPKAKGVGIGTADLSEQAEIALQALRAFVDHTKPKKIVRTVGTPYHEGFDGALKILDARLDVDVVVAECDPFELELDGGHVLNAKHHPEGEAALYVGTVMDRETLWATIAEARQGFPRAKFLIRSHLHMYGRIDACGKILVQTPCWQLATPYARKRRYYRWQPVIGGVLLRHEEQADERYVVAKTTFQLPARKARSYGSL